MGVSIKAVSYYLPEKTLFNNELALLYKDWTPEKILEKTGVNSRHIAGEEEYVSDLAVKASHRLFDEYGIKPCDIGFILLATQSPDYMLPTTACLIQNRLGIPTTAGAIDYNLGCSAYVYGLALSKSLILGGITDNVLLIMAETYSKHIHPMDKSIRTIFGDGAAATYIQKSEKNQIGEFILCTDGSGAEHLIIPSSGMKIDKTEKSKEEVTDENGSIRTPENIYMNGPEIFNFTIKSIPKTVEGVLYKNKLSIDDIALFVFHQANKFMLDYLRKKIRIPEDKFYINLENLGNTVSASIPIALKMAELEKKIKKGDKVMLVGFGVGLSWGATIIEW